MNKITKLCLLAGLVTISGVAFAADGSDLVSVSKHVTTQVRSIANLLIVVAYVAGVGFALAGVVQFKAHKDNPVQVPLSKPIVYLVVGACLLFLPSIMRVAGGTVFEGDNKSGAAEDISTDL